MKVTVEFTCPSCGLWTPGFADLSLIPEGTAPNRKVPLSMECHHCGEEIEKVMRVRELFDLIATK